MRLLSVRKGFETDHSTRSYGYIDGIKLDYDYGTWVAQFRMLYNTDLFKKLNEFDYLSTFIRKEFNKIIVELALYSEKIGEDEYKWVALVNEIKEETKRHNLEPLEVMEAYHTDRDKFKSMKTKTKLGRKLQRLLTPLR